MEWTYFSETIKKLILPLHRYFEGMSCTDPQEENYETNDSDVLSSRPLRKTFSFYWQEDKKVRTGTERWGDLEAKEEEGEKEKEKEEEATGSINPSREGKRGVR